MISIFALFLTACHSAPKTLNDCETTACKEAVLVQMWQDDPGELQKRLLNISDPVEQISYVNVLVEKFPGQTAELCKILPEGPGRDRCQQISMRPHLRSGDKVGSTKGTEAEQKSEPAPQINPELTSASDASIQDGPGMTLLVPSNEAAFHPTPWDDVPAVEASCANAMLITSCRASAAEDAAKVGNAYSAGQVCLSNEAGQWRSECMFHSAEVLVASVDPEEVGASLELCQGSGDFRANCFAHIAMAVANLAPAATDGQPFAWEAVTRGIDALRKDLAKRDATLGDRIAERAWSEAALVSYRNVPRVSGDPLDQVPPEALPHIRAAAAAQLVAAEGGEDRTLAQWNALLKAALALRVHGGPVASTNLSHADAVTNLWTQIYPGEQVLKPVLYMGQARRVWSEDPEADGEICILEALARRPGRPIGPFLDALNSSDQALRWTAARWIQTLDDGTYIRYVQLSADPLVRARGNLLMRDNGGGGGPSNMGGAANAVGVAVSNNNGSVGQGPR